MSVLLDVIPPFPSSWVVKSIDAIECTSTLRSRRIHRSCYDGKETSQKTFCPAEWASQLVVWRTNVLTMYQQQHALNSTGRKKDRLTSQISLPLFSQRLDPVSSIVCTMSVLKKERDLLPRRFGHVFRSIFKKVSKKKKRKSLASFDRYFVSCCHIDIKAIETQVRKEAVRRERKKNRKKKSWLEVSLITH